MLLRLRRGYQLASQCTQHWRGTGRAGNQPHQLVHLERENTAHRLCRHRSADTRIRRLHIIVATAKSFALLLSPSNLSLADDLAADWFLDLWDLVARIGR